VVSNTVERRRREIAIRIALGARPGTVFAMIARQGMTIAMAGTAVGLLFHGFVPAPSSAWANTVAACLVLGASLIACAVPSVRALRVDPMVALREE
jgi:ABC-type antimicrobial peptide transport system permease subunit